MTTKVKRTVKPGTYPIKRHYHSPASFTSIQFWYQWIVINEKCFSRFTMDRYLGSVNKPVYAALEEFYYQT